MNQRFKFIVPAAPITRDDLRGAEAMMPEKDRIEMNDRLIQIKQNMRFTDYSHEVMFERSFQLGYIASHIEEE